LIDLQLLALQAIYGDDMVIFDNMDGLRFFQVTSESESHPDSPPVQTGAVSANTVMHTSLLQIFLHYQLQGDIQVYMNVGTNETTDTRDEGDDEDADDGLLYACSLQHLPPITPTCLLPRSYPRPLLRGRGEVAGRAGGLEVLLCS
jgi:E3 ubiquitin-protein ligase RNF14